MSSTGGQRRGRAFSRSEQRLMNELSQIKDESVSTRKDKANKYHTKQEAKIFTRTYRIRYQKEAMDKITETIEIAESGDTEELLKFWHGSSFFTKFTQGDHKAKDDIIQSYSPGGDDYEREVKHWIAAKDEKPRLSVGLPEGLELDLEGMGVEELPDPVIVAEYLTKEEKPQAFFIVRMAKGHWYAPF